MARIGTAIFLQLRTNEDEDGGSGSSSGSSSGHSALFGGCRINGNMRVISLRGGNKMRYDVAAGDRNIVQDEFVGAEHASGTSGVSGASGAKGLSQGLSQGLSRRRRIRGRTGAV